MVDVSAKAVTRRRAVAEAVVRVSEDLARAIREQTLGKGDLASVVRLAGIQAAKRTGHLIPLCHPLALDHVGVEVDLDGCEVRITAEVVATARTGVEMEALTAVSVAALAVIDMGKSIDRGIVIERVRLLLKEGGSRGRWTVGSPKP